MQESHAFFSIDSDENSNLSPKGNDYNKDLVTKLENLSTHQKSIEETSQIFIEYSLMKNKFTEALELWIFNTLKNTKKLLAYFYLANHIMQESKRKGLFYFTHFFNEMKQILSKTNFPNVNIPYNDKLEIVRVFEVLAERQIFDADTYLIVEYLEYLQSKMPKEPTEEIAKENGEKTKIRIGAELQKSSNVTNLNTKLRFLFREFEKVKFKKEASPEIESLNVAQKSIGNLLFYIKERINSDTEIVEKHLNLVTEIDNIIKTLRFLKN